MKALITVPRPLQRKVLQFFRTNGETLVRDIPREIAVWGPNLWKALESLVICKCLSQRAIKHFGYNTSSYDITETGKKLLSLLEEIEQILNP